jgi:hypothetical protein
MLPQHNFVDLADRGRAWVSESLAAGRAVSKGVLKATDLTNGVALALIAADADPQVLGHDLAIGLEDAKTLTPQVSARELIKLLQMMQARHQRLLLTVVVENDIAKPEDPAVSARNDAIIVNDTVYHYRRVTELTHASKVVSYLGTSASGYPLNAFVLGGVSHDELLSGLNNPTILVPRLHAIINTIFDCDGYMAWVPYREFERT